MTELTKTFYLPRTELSGRQQEEMFALLSKHFDGVTRTQFQKDLAEKNWVILLERNSRLVGFSTLLAYETSFDGEPVSVIYSGDTIVAPEAWNSPALSRAWIACVHELRESYETFVTREQAEGKRLGDIKPYSLSKKTNWSSFFEGDLLSVQTEYLKING